MYAFPGCSPRNVITFACFGRQTHANTVLKPPRLTRRKNTNQLGWRLSFVETTPKSQPLGGRIDRGPSIIADQRTVRRIRSEFIQCRPGDRGNRMVKKDDRLRSVVVKF